MIELSNAEADRLRLLCEGLKDEDRSEALGLIDKAVDEAEEISTPDDLQKMLKKFIGKVRRQLKTKEVLYRVIIGVNDYPGFEKESLSMQMFVFEHKEWRTTQHFESMEKVVDFLEYAILPENHPQKVADRQAYADMH